jgi:hypothetical protein
MYQTNIDCAVTAALIVKDSMPVYRVGIREIINKNAGLAEWQTLRT